jgi:hypothetical protein
MNKSLYFAIATAAAMGYAAGEYDLAVSGALAGQNETREHVFTIDSIPAAFATRIATYLTETECPKVAAKLGNVCDPATVAYDVRIIRRADGKGRVVGSLSLPVYVTERPPVVPGEVVEVP